MDEYEQQADGAAHPSAIPAVRGILSEFTWSAVFRVAAHPFLLVVTVLVGASSLLPHWDLPGVSPLFLMGTLICPAVLEKLIPYQRDWHPRRAERRWYGVCFLLTMAGSALAQLLVTTAVGTVAPMHPALDLSAEIPVALLTGLLGSCFVHRLGHTSPLLRRLHGAHHVPQKVRLNHILASPEQHRPHHSTDFAEAGHYGSDLSCWDHLFGSFTWRPGREPAAVGLGDPTSFPGTGEILASLLHPWRCARKPGSRPA
ncbi:C4-dicarboxylate ABC transporter [Streptomyces sp. NBC_00654]|uniref:sterol desaturase family protein n=1 Tax=Streptomyces sp. NBC_00654 TaxID=2975799 RepID=UPI002258CADB|nr:C4-dicarboxylate ABC transporter [Streptomyces sp. NBC_00654]MCX4966577.1 C4-dicarboxylate ABC transporter [Streptomyces sp. NBC_00654]